MTTTTKQYLITAALPYSNGRLHVGHIAGAYLPADIYVRYLRARGGTVKFICGSDDNGVAALIAARKEEISVEELTAKYNARQAADFRSLRIDFDIFGGTHQPDFWDTHKQFSQDFFAAIFKKGFFTKKATQQLYDPVAKQFLPDRYVQGTCYHPGCNYPRAYGDQCDNCGRTIEALLLREPRSVLNPEIRPEVRTTTHWYLQLSQFEKPLRSWLESKVGNWRPVVTNFALGQVEGGLPERAMTRDLSWGVPVPLDDPDAAGKALYVWFDAPVGYVSFTAVALARAGQKPEEYTHWWKNTDCSIVHFIGEDNIVFHALIWPAMLLAEGSYQLPQTVVANSFLNMKYPDGRIDKISKAITPPDSPVWIEEYAKSFEPDPLRYYLTAIAPEVARTAFSVEDFTTANNSILGDVLGNFINRWMTFAHKYYEGKVPAVGTRTALETEQLARCSEAHRAVTEHLDNFRFKAAMEAVMELARAGNKYFDAAAPFRSRKTDLGVAGTAINVCAQTGRTLATLLGPFLPTTAERIAAQLRLDAATDWDRACQELPAGHALGEPKILFGKLEAPKAPTSTPNPTPTKDGAK